MSTLRYSTWVALLLAIILTIFCAGAGQWLLASINFTLACTNVALLYETRRR